MKRILLAAVLLLSGSIGLASGGTDVGGGGRGIICKQPDGRKTVELLDLYEARAVYNLTLEKYSGTFEQVRDKVLSKMVAGIWSKPSADDYKVMNEELDLVMKNLRFLPPGDKLKPVNDSHEPFIPGNCKIEQLAHWRDANLVLVNSDLWNAMDSTNKVALIMHESIYRNDRLQGLKNSLYARKAVGYLFSTTQLESMDGGLPFRRVSCADKVENYYLRYYVNYYPKCTGKTCGTVFQFDVLDGQTLITKTTAYFPSVYYESLIGTSDISLWGFQSAPIESVITSGDEVRINMNTKKGELASLSINRTLNTNGMSVEVPLSCQWVNGNSTEPQTQETGHGSNR